ncbi:MAG: hypothetical protein MJ252_16295 [archaeon]|nr:hypothetical protein [archaeon]
MDTSKPKIHQPWNKKKAKVYNITFNQDKTLLVVSTSAGYRIFEAGTFALVSEVNDFQDIIGPLSYAITLYGSQLVFFIGRDDNLTFPNNQLIVWDEIINKKIAIIFLRDPISYFYLTMKTLFVFSGTSIFVFEVCTLKYAFKIPNMNMNSKVFSVASNETFAYNTFQNKSTVILEKLFFDKYTLKGRSKREIKTDFQDIQNILLSDSGERLLISSIFGNKIHLYNTENLNLEFCLFLGEKISSIDNLSFSPFPANKIIFIYQQKKILIYSVKPSFDVSCYCGEHKDEDLLKPPKNEGGGWFSFLGGGNKPVKYFLI